MNKWLKKQSQTMERNQVLLMVLILGGLTQIEETDRLAKNPYVSSSSPSPTNSPVVAKFSNSPSRSRSRSRSHSKEILPEEEKGKKRARDKRYDSIFIIKILEDSQNSHDSESEKGHKRDYHNSHNKKNQIRLVKPLLNGPLLSLKHFMEIQRDPIDLPDAEKYYAEYKKSHEKSQNENFFKMHKDEHWFKEKYHPEDSYQWQTERKVQAQLLAKKFFEQLKKNAYQGLSLEAPLDEVTFRQDEANNRIEITKAPYFGFDQNSMTLFLKALPVNISRWEVLNIVKTTPGFVSFSLSDPLKTQNFVRYAWVSFDSEENCTKSKILLENASIGSFRLGPIKSQSSKKPIKITPPLPEGRELIDLELSKQLILLLDEEKQIKDNELLGSAQTNDKILQLDLQLLYLRKVHALCYYSMEEFDDDRMLAAKSGPAFIRSKKRVSKSEETMPENIISRNFVESIDKFVASRLAKPQVKQQKVI